MQRPGNRGCRQRQHIHRASKLFQFFFVFDAEALFLIQHQQAQVIEGNILLQKSVSADHDIDFAGLEIVDNGPLNACRAETA